MTITDDLLRFTPEQKKQLASKLSGGQKRLLSFVLTLIGRPSLLFLDEPTAAMDTSTRQRFWEIVGHLKDQGSNVGGFPLMSPRLLLERPNT